MLDFINELFDVRLTDGESIRVHLDRLFLMARKGNISETVTSAPALRIIPKYLSEADCDQWTFELCLQIQRLE